MDEEYTYDECGRQFPLTQVQITNDGERTVCGSCLTVEDRIIDYTYQNGRYDEHGAI